MALTVSKLLNRFVFIYTSLSQMEAGVNVQNSSLTVSINLNFPNISFVARHRNRQLLSKTFRIWSYLKVCSTTGQKERGVATLKNNIMEYIEDQVSSICSDFLVSHLNMFRWVCLLKHPTPTQQTSACLLLATCSLYCAFN